MRLAIDTSGVDQALVVLDGRRLVAADDWIRARADPPGLARLDAVGKRAGARPDDLEAVVAARGPGSFTGLRIGLSLAAGLAYARHIPLYVADSLPILAPRATRGPATWALRDARRGEVYGLRGGEAARRLPADQLAGWVAGRDRGRAV